MVDRRSEASYPIKKVMGLIRDEIAGEVNDPPSVIAQRLVTKLKREDKALFNAFILAKATEWMTQLVSKMIHARNHWELEQSKSNRFGEIYLRLKFDTVDHTRKALRVMTRPEVRFAAQLAAKLAKTNTQRARFLYAVDHAYDEHQAEDDQPVAEVIPTPELSALWDASCENPPDFGEEGGDIAAGE